MVEALVALVITYAVVLAVLIVAAAFGHEAS